MKTATTSWTAPAPSVRPTLETRTPEVGSPSAGVLIALDGFDTQHAAVKFGTDLARETGAPVWVVHVREREVFGRARFYLETEEEARQLVDEAVAEIRKEGVRADGYVVEAVVGRTADALIDAAGQVGAGRIVIGAKRSGGILGRRTRERLLRRSALPVLVAPRVSEAVIGARHAESGRRQAA